MSRSKLRLALFALAAACGTALLALAPARSDLYRTHPHRMECRQCHVAAGTVTSDNAHILNASQEQLCGNCHPKAVTMSHPTGFAPTAKLPKDYPADWKGDLTCSTCHEPHGATRGRMRGDREGKALCLSCHEARFFERMPDHGASMVLSGHLSSVPEMRGAGIDEYSLQCLECHANEGGPLNARLEARGLLRHAKGGMSHPIGASYAEAVRFGGFRPQAQLSKAIHLPGGRVSCVSCHEGYAKQHGRLVMSNNGSRLCLECHNI